MLELLNADERVVVRDADWLEALGASGHPDGLEVSLRDVLRQADPSSIDGALCHSLPDNQDTTDIPIRSVWRPGSIRL